LGRCELSSKELSRAEVMGQVKAGNLRLREAGELLELSYRQAKRIWARYRKGGGESSAAWQLRSALEPCLRGRISPGGAGTGAEPL